MSNRIIEKTIVASVVCLLLLTVVDKCFYREWLIKKGFPETSGFVKAEDFNSPLVSDTKRGMVRKYFEVNKHWLRKDTIEVIGLKIDDGFFDSRGNYYLNIDDRFEYVVLFDKEFLDYDEDFNYRTVFAGFFYLLRAGKGCLSTMVGNYYSCHRKVYEDSLSVVPRRFLSQMGLVYGYDGDEALSFYIFYK